MRLEDRLRDHLHGKTEGLVGTAPGVEAVVRRARRRQRRTAALAFVAAVVTVAGGVLLASLFGGSRSELVDLPLPPGPSPELPTLPAAELDWDSAELPSGFLPDALLQIGERIVISGTAAGGQPAYLVSDDGLTWRSWDHAALFGSDAVLLHAIEGPYGFTVAGWRRNTPAWPGSFTVWHSADGASWRIVDGPTAPPPPHELVGVVRTSSGLVALADRTLLFVFDGYGIDEQAVMDRFAPGATEAAIGEVHHIEHRLRILDVNGEELVDLTFAELGLDDNVVELLEFGRTEVWSSEDGERWSQVGVVPFRLGGFRPWPGIAAGGTGGVAAVGSRFEVWGVWWSEDGERWEQTLTAPVVSLAAGPDRYLALASGAGGLVGYLSFDGQTWSRTAVATEIGEYGGATLTEGFYDLSFEFVAGGEAGFASFTWFSPPRPRSRTLFLEGLKVSIDAEAEVVSLSTTDGTELLLQADFARIAAAGANTLPVRLTEDGLAFVDDSGVVLLALTTDQFRSVFGVVHRGHLLNLQPSLQVRFSADGVTWSGEVFSTTGQIGPSLVGEDRVLVVTADEPGPDGQQTGMQVWVGVTRP